MKGRDKMSRFSKIRRFFVCSPLVIFLMSQTVYAIDEDGIVDILEKNKEFFVTNMISSDVFRWIGWGLVKGLKNLANVGEKLYKNSFELLTFSVGSDFNTWISAYKPLFTALIAVSFVVLGIILIFNHEKKPNVLNNIVLMLAVVSCTLTVMSQLNDVIKQGVNAIVDQSPSLSTINDNFYDLYYIDVKKDGLANMKKANYGKYHYDQLTDKEMELIDINETLNPNKNGLTADGKEILGKRLDVVSKAADSGKNKLSDVYNGLGWNSQDDDDLFNEFYYRYKINFFSTYLVLIAYIIVYFCMAYKVVRIIFELAIHRILSVLYSADITGGQKTLKIITSIKDGYIVLLFSAMMIKLFTMMNTFISNKFPDEPLIRNIYILFIAFSVCDGPNIIEKLTGIDAGLSSGVGKIIAGYHMARGAVSTVTMPGRFAYQQHMQNRMIRGMENMAGKGQLNTANQNKNAFPDIRDTEKSSGENMPSGDQTKNSNLNASSTEKQNKSMDPESGVNSKTASDTKPNDIHEGNSEYPFSTDQNQGSNEIDQNMGENSMLNGFDPGRGTEYGNAAGDMQQMEKDLNSKDNSVNSVVGRKEMNYNDKTNLKKAEMPNSTHENRSNKNIPDGKTSLQQPQSMVFKEK